MCVILLSLQPMGTFPDCHDFSNTMGQLSNCISQFPPGPEKHQVPQTCLCSGLSGGLKPDLRLLWEGLHSPSPWGSRTWEIWEEWLSVKSKAKNCQGPQPSPPWCHYFSCLIYHGGWHIFISVPFLCNALIWVKQDLKNKEFQHCPLNGAVYLSALELEILFCIWILWKVGSEPVWKVTMF